jgi:hypothetical protein
MNTTTTQHTPGPWESHGCAIYTEETWQEGKRAGGALVGSTFYDRSDPDSDAIPSDEQIANARLIAAAPEMLEALEALAEYWQHGTPVHPGALVAREAQAAIAKAKGS